MARWLDNSEISNQWKCFKNKLAENLRSLLAGINNNSQHINTLLQYTQNQLPTLTNIVARHEDGHAFTRFLCEDNGVFYYIGTSNGTSYVYKFTKSTGTIERLSALPTTYEGGSLSYGNYASCVYDEGLYILSHRGSYNTVMVCWRNGAWHMRFVSTSNDANSFIFVSRDNEDYLYLFCNGEIHYGIYDVAETEAWGYQHRFISTDMNFYYVDRVSEYEDIGLYIVGSSFSSQYQKHATLTNYTFSTFSELPIYPEFPINDGYILYYDNYAAVYDSDGQLLAVKTYPWRPSFSDKSTMYWVRSGVIFAKDIIFDIDMGVL